MQIKQWEDKNLAHFSYAVLSDCEKKIVLIDPSRDPRPYIDFAKANEAEITGIIETHPHADFISGHLELSQLTGAIIYASTLVDAAYPHEAFDDGDAIEFGKIKLSALHTPGHSPDSICILLEHKGQQKAVFTGDTLFIGDCGRPDLREGAGNLRVARLELAKQMYHSLRDKLLPLDDDVIVYPAHGAGTLCGKHLSEANSSTIGHEKESNWSLQPMAEAAFIETLLKDQPFVPAYFPFDVEVNRKGARSFADNIALVNIGGAITNETAAARLNKAVLIVDSRPDEQYRQGHLPNSVNLMEGPKFETWLGSIIQPGEPFYLAGENNEQLQRLIERTASIGYEPQIKEAFVLEYGDLKEPALDVENFKQNLENYTIVDVRNASELHGSKPFKNSISMPLPELRKSAGQLPTNKPIVVHCASGYRSAAGSSIIKSTLKDKVEVFDLSEAIHQFGL